MINIVLPLAALLLLVMTFEQYHFVYSTLPNITVISKSNPNRVNVGDSSMIVTTIENHGNTIAKLFLPWANKSVDLNTPEIPGIIEPSNILVTGSNLSVPASALAGIYELELVVRANESDYAGLIQVTIDAIQGIPLSGEIPLSVISIITLGILTYFIIVYFLTNKFEMGIVSISFGILSWSLFNYLTGKSISSYRYNN